MEALESHTPETIARKIMGPPGRMIAGSKGRFQNKYPSKIPIFNANIVCNGKKIWYGDICITDDKDILLQLAREAGSFHILHEMDARFENENAPLIEKHAFCVTSQAILLGPQKDPRHYYQKTNGKMYQYTIGELRKLYPEEYPSPKPYPLDEKDFTKKEISIPLTKSTFKFKKSDKPLHAIYEFFLNNGLTEKNIERLYLTKAQNDIVESAIKGWLKKNGLDDYQIQKEMCWLTLDIPWYDMDTQSWEKEGYFYIKKNVR